MFRDLGFAFAVVLILIYGLVVGWFQSFLTPLIIMAAIPFSLVGIIPAHGLLHAFFTATSMIGFIAGAGIVVRNSIILVDFIELRLREGMPLDQAVIDARNIQVATFWVGLNPVESFLRPLATTDWIAKTLLAAAPQMPLAYTQTTCSTGAMRSATRENAAL